jgi:hypothetical protein
MLSVKDFWFLKVVFLAVTAYQRCETISPLFNRLYSEIVSGSIVFSATLVGRRGVFVMNSNLGPSAMSRDGIATSKLRCTDLISISISIVHLTMAEREVLHFLMVLLVVTSGLAGN